MSTSVREQRQGRSGLVFAVKVSGPAWCSLLNLCIHHLSSLWLPDPSRFTQPAPLLPTSILLPLSVRRSGAVFRTRWHLSWQQLSVSAINYTGWLTPFSTLILAFIHPLGISTSYDSEHLWPNHHANADLHFSPRHPPTAPAEQCIAIQTIQTHHFSFSNVLRMSLDMLHTAVHMNGEYVTSQRV